MGQGAHTDFSLGMIIENMPQNKLTIDEMSKQIGELASMLAMQLGIEINPNTISTVKDLEKIFKDFNISIQQSSNSINLLMRNAQGVSGSLKGVFDTEKLNFDVGEVTLTENRINALRNLQNTYKEVENAMRQMSSVKPEDQQSEYYGILTEKLDYYMQRLKDLRAEYSKGYQVDFSDENSTDELVVANRKIEAKIKELQAENQLKNAKAQKKETERQEAQQTQTNVQKVREYIAALQAQYREEEKLARLKKAGASADTIQAQQDVVDEYRNQADTLKDQIKGTKEYADAKDKITAAEKKHTATLKETNDTGTKSVSVFGKFKDTLKQVVEAGLSWKIFSAMTQSLKKVYQTVVELDKSLVDLQIVMGTTREQAKQTLLSYSDMAQELGSTTQEVANAAVEWQRQGYSVADTNSLIRNSMILSKVGMVESAEAQEYLTSAMKGYGVAAEDSLGIVDKLSAIDMDAAVSAGGLAEAMSRTATSAKLAGVGMDELLGYLAVVGETTQKSMSSVGESKIIDALKVA